MPPLPPEPEPSASTALAPVFQNQGGLFMPEQLPTVLPELKRLGLKLDPALLADPLSSLLASIVNIGGCSASFISASGLIATNHHCAIVALQYNSTPAANLLRDGFLAASPQSERFAGPTARVFVTRALRGVTNPARSALAAATDDVALLDAL